MCKTLERLIAGELMRYLEGNGILSSNQFGFRPNLSVADQLVKVYEYVASAYDGRNIVEMLLFDFRKAFDVVCHNILMDKLGLIGITQILFWDGLEVFCLIVLCVL